MDLSFGFINKANKHRKIDLKYFDYFYGFKYFLIAYIDRKALVISCEICDNELNIWVSVNLIFNHVKC